MSKHITLEAQKRTTSGTAAARRMRREGIIPAVIYGAAQDEYPVQVNAKKFGELLRSSASENFLVDLQIEGAKESSKLALIQDVQHHPLSGIILHIDFNAVNENQEIHASVPLELTGDAPGVKAGGIVDQQHYELEVHCLPTNLPESLTVDIGELEMGASLHVGDIKFPEGVSATLGDDVIVVLVAEPRVSAADTAADEAASAASAEESAKSAAGAEAKTDAS
ncbi:MAG: large subunit ribosomal protein L25 [Verrucomicrobiales bacterium]|jgi:large subunit ribosomal protein L25